MNVKYLPILALCLAACGGGSHTNAPQPTVYVDDNGLMRSTETHAEVSYCGVNYTVPFAHAYRELQRRGIDHKRAIDRDVYHMARLGFNAFRLHLWDVEIADSTGRLLNNSHLDLLDYLVAKVEERGIAVMLTLQTNFGNGYPEHNIPTDGYSYKYEKCNVHDDASAQAAQLQYVADFMQHVNAYTGRAYGSDPAIVGFEINNEPCHSGTPDAVRRYIDTTMQAMRDAGCTRPIFYNVSHNDYCRHVFFEADIDGGTYQWYPTSLVGGRTRQGNFLPALDRYAIPFDTLPGFADKAKIIYEFDPADLTTTYQYAAAVRAFRTAGFQWITQFSYDPIDIADCNTEYQTHYMNLAYTPGKALGMAVATLVALDDTRCKDYGTYPADTIFGNATVSYKRDLALYNSPRKFVYSNTNDVVPADANALEHVAGVGSSAVVEYGGTGAYFLDRLEKGVWRLEVMPDAIPVADAYAKPSPQRKATLIANRLNDMTLHLPDLGDGFKVEAIAKGNAAARCDGRTIRVLPGVYLLTAADARPAVAWSAGKQFGNTRVGEFVAPAADDVPLTVVHTPAAYGVRGEPLQVQCTVAGTPDSVVLYPSWVSFWRTDNPTLTMTPATGYDYSATVPAEWTKGGDFGYYIVAFGKSGTVTYPENVGGTPLDWDSRATATYATRLLRPGDRLPLVECAASDNGVEPFAFPYYDGITVERQRNMPASADALLCTFAPPRGKCDFRYFIRKFVGDELRGIGRLAADKRRLCIVLSDVSGLDKIDVALVNADGLTFGTTVPVNGGGTIGIDLSDLRLRPTAIVPAGYPSFVEQYFRPDGDWSLAPADVEFLELSVQGVEGKADVGLVGCYLE